MTEPDKIKNGIFAGSYSAPKKRNRAKWVLIFLTVIFFVGTVGWLFWRIEMSKRLNKETYESALVSSDDAPPLYLSDVERNARFQKHSGITMDAYLKNPRSINGAKDKYEAAKLLLSGSHFKESSVLYGEILDGDTLPGDVDDRVFYNEASQAARLAKDGKLAGVAGAKYKESVMNSDKMDDEMKLYLIEEFENDIK